MAEVVLGEIGHAPGPELEFAENRESYSLSAGIALGMITLGASRVCNPIEIARYVCVCVCVCSWGAGNCRAWLTCSWRSSYFT